MREVSQNWIDNQNKTLRDQGLLRLDFLSAHNNNSKADIIPMGSDASKSNINEIKDIAPYGAPSKNLAMPNLEGREYLGGGWYRVQSNSGLYLDYNINTSHYRMHGVGNGNNRISYTFSSSNNPDIIYSYSIYLVERIEQPPITIQFGGTSADINERARLGNTDNEAIRNSALYNPSTVLYTAQFTGPIDVTFKLQWEQGTQATDYEIPQPNTGYVSTNLSGPNGEVATNLAMPDLTGATDLGGGVYRIYSTGGFTVDYNVNSGHFIYNGTSDGTGTISIFSGFNLPIGQYTLSIVKVSGEQSSGTLIDTYLRTSTTPMPSLYIIDNIGEVNSLTYNTTELTDLYIRRRTGITYTNYTFKLQLEQGDTANAYQLPDFTPIEVNIEDYRSPLNGLTITWSENFGHAVDYSIEYNGEIYTYLNNDKKTVFVPIIVENTPDANFKIRVHKWSEPNSPIRIERVFAGLHLVYKQDKIFSFNKKKINNVLGLELPQDEINFELSNIDRMFDPLWFNSYFKYLNEKTEIRAYSGFKYGENGEEWIKQGTYYLTNWKAPNNAITATFTARDILNLLDADEMYSKDTPLTLDEYCDIILDRDYKGVDDYVPYDLPVNPDGSNKWNIRKNLAMPDLSAATDLGGGNYRVYNDNGVTVDYNINNGLWTINGIWTDVTGSSAVIDYKNINGLILTVSVEIVSGVLPAGTIYRPSGMPEYDISLFKGISYEVPYSSNNDHIRMANGAVFNNFQYRVQLEKGSQSTPYQLPIENANIPVLKETVTKREALQLIAQSIGCHIKVDDDGNISFISETYGNQLNVPKKILLTKPEFNLSTPVKKIIVPVSTYNPDPSELELAQVNVKGGDIVELNHNTPYINGSGTNVTGAGLTLGSMDTTWYRSFKATISGDPNDTGVLIIKREPVIKSTINMVQDISSSGETLTYENNLIDTQAKAARAIGKIWGELDNSREVEFELRIDPRFDTFNVVSFPFRVLNLEQVEYMRIDELELSYNGAYKGKIKGVILSNYGGDLTAKIYTKRADDFASGEENLKWHLLNE